MKVVALKYRFLMAFDSVTLPILKLQVTARTGFGPATSDQTSIAYEIGTVENSEMIFVTETGVNHTDDGEFVQTESPEDGVYLTASLSVATEYDVGIVVIIVTFDAKGQTSPNRASVGFFFAVKCPFFLSLLRLLARATPPT